MDATLYCRQKSICNAYSVVILCCDPAFPHNTPLNIGIVSSYHAHQQQRDFIITIHADQFPLGQQGKQCSLSCFIHDIDLGQTQKGQQGKRYSPLCFISDIDLRQTQNNVDLLVFMFTSPSRIIRLVGHFAEQSQCYQPMLI